MNIDIQLYLALLWRRLPVMLVLVVVFSAAGIVAALRLPETYSTSARLLVEEPQIPDRMVTSTVQTEADEQLDIIQQKLLTRANLIDIANRFNVFPDLRQMEPDEVVDAMRNATSLKRSGGRDRATLLTVSFSSETPEIAAAVVNEYITLLLEENSEFRQSRAEDTLQFFSQEVDRLGQELDRQSAAIVTFKSENADALPEDQNYRLGRQNLFQERLSRLERDLRSAEAQREDIVRIFESTGKVQGENGPSEPRTQAEKRLATALAQLENARVIYSENSPRLISLQSVVDRLQSIVLAERAEGLETAEVSPEQALYQATLTEIDSRIETTKEEIAEAQTALDELQDTMRRSVANGIQLAALQRDYKITQDRYNATVANLNDARMSERVEATAKGRRISVIENATVPQVPSGPDRKKTAIKGAAVGAGLAGAYFVLLEILNRTIRSSSELTGRFGITPITAIPYMPGMPGGANRRSHRLQAAAVVLVLLVMGAGGAAALLQVDGLRGMLADRMNFEWILPG